jgi:hypothetical protein
MDFPHDKHVWINQYMITGRSFCIDLNTIDLNELGASTNCCLVYCAL